MSNKFYDELIALTAEGAVELLRSRQIKPSEMVEASAYRIAETDTKINALPTLCLDRAMDHAKRLEASNVQPHAPQYLYGLPIAVKDNVDVAGVRSTSGSLVFEHRVAETSDIVVQRLEENGAIVVAKSNLPEFACGGNTFNDVFGATKNPWDIKRTAGGSSGGAAAALAAGQVWLATGNDFAGSIRNPASYCSVVGFRPSPGMVPRVQKQPFSPLSIEGSMARTVADAALMFDAEVGWHPADPLTQRYDHPSYYQAAKRPALPKRVAYTFDLGLIKPEKAVLDVCRRAIELLAHEAVELEEQTIDLRKAAKGFEVLRGAIYVGRVGHLLEEYRHVIKPEVVENAEYGLTLSVHDILQAEADHGELIRLVERFFRRHDLLIAPITLTAAYPVEWRYLTQVNDRHFDGHLGSLMLTYAVSMMCCPSIAIPAGFSADGLPVGVQLIGPPRGEAQLFAAAAYLEQLFKVAPSTPIDPR